MKIRSAPNYKRFFPELGIASVMIDPAGGVYIPANRLCGCFLSTAACSVLTKMGGPIRPNVLYDPFWNQNCTILMSSARWEEIGEADREAIIKATADYEKEMVAYFEQEEEKEEKSWKRSASNLSNFRLQMQKSFLLLTTWNGKFIQAEVNEKAERLRKLTEKDSHHF